MWAGACLALPVLAQSTGDAAPAAATAQRFIACPVYRDTVNGRKSGCWLATDNETGLRYDLQQALTKPQLGREVLVEGELPPPGQRADDACGGLVLKPVRVSVLPAACTPVILPAEGHAGTPFQLPASVMTPNYLPQKQPAPPYTSRQFTVQFDHGDDYLLYQHAEVILQEAARLAQLGSLRYVLVQGYAATRPTTVSGRLIAESEATAQARAEMAAEALRRLGVPAARIKTAWRGDPAPLPDTAPGLREASKRRVVIDVQTGPVPVFATPAPPPYANPKTPQGSGPYPAVMEADAGLPTHTVYRPANLAALGPKKLPIVAFANGGCANLGSRFRYFLTEIASHGFIAIAIGPVGVPEAEQTTGGREATRPVPGSPAERFAAAGITGDAARRNGLGPGQTLPAQLTQAIDWAIAENTRAGSRYQGRIDIAQIAVMGQSCGGLQAIAAAQDPRIKTLGVWNSGILSDAPLNAHISGADVGPDSVARLSIPTLYVTGEPSDVAFDNADADFARITQAPLVRAWREQTGHGGTYREANGGAFGVVAVAWLKWRLQADATAGRYFSGVDCGLCLEPGWHVKRRRID